MRVLLLDDDGFTNCVEITDIGYTKDEEFEGLFMYDYCDCTYYIPGINEWIVKEICQVILERGFYDLTCFGKCVLEVDM